MISSDGAGRATPLGMSSEDIRRIYELRRDVRLADARPNDGRCGNVAAAIAAEFGWVRECGYLRLLDGSVSWVHCWNRLTDGRILDATADQFDSHWIGDVVVIDADDAAAANYLANPRQWDLRAATRSEVPTSLVCTSGDDEQLVNARQSEHPWLSLARATLRLVTGWDLDDRLTGIAARALRAKLTVAGEASTADLIRPLLTESIHHAGRRSPQPWIAAEFRSPL